MSAKQLGRFEKPFDPEVIAYWAALNYKIVRMTTPALVDYLVLAMEWEAQKPKKSQEERVGAARVLIKYFVKGLDE